MKLGQTSGWLIVAEPPEAYAPRPGDLICLGRGGARDLRYDDLPAGHFPGHCDIVVDTSVPGQISVVGGNVDDAVTLKHVPVAPDGRLATSGRADHRSALQMDGGAARCSPVRWCHSCVQVLPLPLREGVGGVGVRRFAWLISCGFTPPPNPLPQGEGRVSRLRCHCAIASGPTGGGPAASSASISTSENTRERVMNRTPSAASSEKLSPPSDTTSMVS